ncbi:MAG: MCE family protein [Rhizobacter sp.]|nr:MCE family protein [Ferruginibacter sp.]
MRTSKTIKVVVVGIFTFIGVIILGTALFTVGGEHDLFEKYITVKSSFANVNGLQAGNNVWFEGVKVGTVKSVSLSANSQVVVNMKIEKKFCQYIYNDTKAKIGTDGLIGNKIIVLTGGRIVPIIKDGDSIIVEKALTTEDLMAKLKKNNDNLLDITSDFKTISHSIVNGKGSIGKLLKDESLYNNLQSVVGLFKQASLNTQQLSANLETYSSKLKNEGSFANDVVTDTVVFSKLRETVTQIQEISQKVNVVSNNLQTASVGMNDSTKTIGSLIHSQETADNLKLTFQNLNSSSQKLNHDLESLQHNFLLRHYFKKKEKKQAKKTVTL